MKKQPEATFHKRSDVDLLLFYMTLKENLEIKNLHILWKDYYLTFIKVACHQELEIWLIQLCCVSVYLSHHLVAPGLNHFKGNEWSSFDGTVWLMLLWVRHADSVQLSLMHISKLWVEMSTDEMNHFQRRQVRVWPSPSDDVFIWHWTHAMTAHLGFQPRPHSGLGRQKWETCIEQQTRQWTMCYRLRRSLLLWRGSRDNHINI